VIALLALIFWALWTWTSYGRWANFEYRTFDLAFYVQGIWQFLHGRFDVSVLGVPLLGNHVEPIVFLFAPFFFLVRHPLIFVALQNAGLALTAPIGYRIARRLGLEPFSAGLAAASILLAPATSYIAVHEFHPEALAAPLLLLMLEAATANALRRYWICFIAVLACKENMALLLIAYCLVQLFVNRSQDARELCRWLIWPLIVAFGWFILCTFVITPAFNRGNVDYSVLYGRLGASPAQILKNFLLQPELAGKNIAQALLHGNLLWALLLSFAGLPLLRPRWLLIASPILLQHLLSWRQSEWSIYFHYAAPLLPLFWMAAVETVVSSKVLFALAIRKWAAPAMLFCALGGQVLFGPLPQISDELGSYPAKRSDRMRKNALIARIPADASVVAPLPYLSHLAMREHLYSLHFILKGLKTLSHARYQPPPPTDYVLIDRTDSATFDSAAGYYHPAMQTRAGQIIPSSDDLLRDFLSKATWDEEAGDPIILLRRHSNSPDKPDR
jgi:uncharacterized membrane protein